MIRAVVNKDILWPQKQEDREEGGWKKHASEAKVCDLRRCSTSSIAVRLRPDASQAPSVRVVTGTGDGDYDQWGSRSVSANVVVDMAENFIAQNEISAVGRRDAGVRDMV